MTKRHVPKGPTVEQRAYAHTISIHCPNITEVEMQARVGCAKIRDEAGVGVMRCDPSLTPMLEVIARLAQHSSIAPMQASEAIRLKAALQLSLDAARILEQALQPWQE